MGVVRYEMTWEEYWRAHEVCWRAATGSTFLRLVPLTGWIAILAGFAVVFVDGLAEVAPVFWLFGAAFLSTRAARWWVARRAFRRRAPGSGVEVEWDEAGLSVREGEGERTLPWEAARVLLVTSEGFFVEGGAGPGIWLPYSGFAHREEIERFEAEVREREVPLLDRRSVG